MVFEHICKDIYLDWRVEVMCLVFGGCSRVVGTGAPGVSSAAERANVKETAIRMSTTQVVVIITNHPASLVQDWPSSSVDPFRYGDVN